MSRNVIIILALFSIAPALLFISSFKLVLKSPESAPTHSVHNSLDITSKEVNNVGSQVDCLALESFLSQYSTHSSSSLYNFLAENNLNDYDELLEYGNKCNQDIHQYLESSMFDHRWKSNDKPRILITNSAVMNTGDAAILISTLRLIKEALQVNELEVIVFDLFNSRGNNFGSQHYPQATFIPFDANEVPLGNTQALEALSKGKLLEGIQHIDSVEMAERLWIIAQADIVVASGGTYIVPHYGQSYRLRLYHTINALAPNKFMMMTQSMGPFHKNWKMEFKQIVEQTSLILLRDEKSKEYLEQLAPNELNRIHVVADSVFGMLSVEEVETNINAFRESFYAQGAIQKVGVNVRQWGNKKSLMSNFLGSVAKAVEYLVKNEIYVEFVSTCQGVPGYRDDSNQAKQVVSMLPNELRSKVVINQDWHDPHGLVEKYKQFDMVISTRMHGAVLSLIGGVPVLPIEYEFKMSELFRRLGHPEWVTSIKDIKPQSFTSLTQQFIKRLETTNLYNSMMEGVIQQQKSAWNSITHIRNAFDGKIPSWQKPSKVKYKYKTIKR